MRTLAIASVVGLMFMVSPLSGSDTAQAASGSDPVVFTSVRASWPIAREASGYWGVIGEAVARHGGGRAVAIRSVTLAVEGANGRCLLQETLDTPELLGQIVRVFARDPSGAQAARPAGTITMEPDDTAVVFLAALVDPRYLPRRAEVSVRFSHGPERRIAVPLEVFSPGQQMGWPLRLDGRPWQAHNTAGTDHHWLDGALVTRREVFISQRFALDLVQVDADDRTHPASATGKESYYAWGEDVLSAGRGRVVAVLDDQQDLEPGASPAPLSHPAGNHVVVQHGRGLFSVYAHLQQSSAVVRAGDWIERGQVLGRVGSSGNTSEPHLHVHFTDRWDDSAEPLRNFYFSQGVPALFWGAQVLRDGITLPLRGTTPTELDLIVGAGR